MVDKIQIEEWVAKGTITSEQASKMLVDSSAFKKDKSSNRFISALSTIGAILLGLGAILFVSSNWDVLTDVGKTAILVLATLGAYTLGYFMKYKWQNLPRTGGALIFLGALLFGATVFLLAQIYNVNAGNPTLVLIWLVGVLPLVYSLASVPMAGLSALLFYIWIASYLWEHGSEFGPDLYRTPALYLVASIALFGFGALHYLSPKLHKVARAYRLFGLRLSLASLFVLTFEFFSSGANKGWFGGYRGEAAYSGEFTIFFAIFAVLAILLSVVSLFFNPARADTNSFESSLALTLAALTTVFFFFPATSIIYSVIFNLALAGVGIGTIYTGYRREDMKVINAGAFWIALLILARYFDFFWDMLSTSVFFMVGGAILILGGIALERKRRELKARFNSATPAAPTNPAIS
ncbi:MAG TPA: DUF2157 domain-containing protein [Candidatus Paceibacterota bacterium]